MATVPFSFACDTSSGFITDPNVHNRIGYLTDFGGLGLSMPLAKDITVSLPYNNPAPTYAPIAPVQNTVHVVAVLEQFEWNGSVGDPLNISCYVSQENATQLKTLQQTALTTTKVNSLGFWIANYDQETKQWFEQAHPQNPVKLSGLLKSGNFNIDLTPVPVKQGIDVMVYKVSFAVAPGANQQSALLFANSSTQHVIKSWGLTVGMLPVGGIEGSV